jgi:dinuclear metal center YbgI/SA1388 family protein
MRVGDLAAAMERIAPLGAAEPWDNVGLLVGEASAELKSVLLTIDLTAQVAREAIDMGAGAVVAYHPPIFKPIKRLVAPDVIFDAIRSGLAIYSPHTALDAAPGGTADMLADVLGLITRQALRGGDAAAVKAVAPLAAGEVKLVTFVPFEQADALADALFVAGAGRIGNYTACSFRSEGTGTFFGQAGTDPAVGQAGRLERVAEVRLETVVPAGRLAAVVAALIKTHPYEEPAYDLVQLAAKPAAANAIPDGGNAGRGPALIGDLPPIERQALVAKIKQALEIEHLLIAGPDAGIVRRAACCPGSCGEVLDAALAGGAELYLTGELRHHDALRAAAAGLTVVAVLHSNSERAVLKRLRERLMAELGGLQCELSRQDRDPFRIA